MKNTTFAIWCICLMIALSCGKSEKPTRLISRVQLSKCYECLLPPMLNAQNVLNEINKNNIAYPDIVLRQSILETGWYTSYNCTIRNNLFGMTGGVKTSDNPHGYKIYPTWMHSVKDYKTWQSRRLTYRGLAKAGFH